MRRYIMVREKVVRVGDAVEVIYDSKRWCILVEKRRETLKIMSALFKYGLNPIVHGSIARGDVREASDIDVVIPYVVPSYRIELALENAGYIPYRRIVVQATPQHAIKAYIVLDELETRVVSFPLVRLSRKEYEFYKFGGLLELSDLKENVLKRVPGVDKRLMLIKPTEKGHVEEPIIGREAEVASILGISVDVVEERVRVLTRRDKLGRTGVFVKYELKPTETFEEALDKLARENPHVRRIVYERM